MQGEEKNINILVEGLIDEVVARQIINYVHLKCELTYGKNGKNDLLQRLPKYNQAANFSAWLVLVDLNHSAPCAPEFIRKILPTPSQHMLLRVAVHAVESWLLADRENLSAFLGISISRIPIMPDNETDPKLTLINLARQSRWKEIRAAMVPRHRSGAKVGLGYPGKIIEFLTSGPFRWNPEIAMKYSPSLHKCINALQILRDQT